MRRDICASGFASWCRAMRSSRVGASQESVCSSSCPGLRINVSKLVVFDYEIGILRRGLRDWISNLWGKISASFLHLKRDFSLDILRRGLHGWISSLWGRSHFDKAPSRRRQSDVSRTEVSWPSYFLPLKETFPRQSGGKVHHEYPAEGLENAFSSTGKRESPSQA